LCNTALRTPVPIVEIPTKALIQEIRNGKSFIISGTFEFGRMFSLFLNEKCKADFLGDKISRSLNYKSHFVNLSSLAVQKYQ
jgi:hypothetical protein